MANTDQKIEEIMKRVLAKMETGNEMKTLTEEIEND